MAARAVAPPAVLRAGRVKQAITALLVDRHDKAMAPLRESSGARCSARSSGALKPLPTEPYVPGRWSVAAEVNVDHQVALERCSFSFANYVRKIIPAATPTKQLDVSDSP